MVADESARFETKDLSTERDTVAPDGSDVRIGLALRRAGLARFELAPGQCSVAVRHRTVEEIWIFVAGRGEMWRRDEAGDETVDVAVNTCITIPRGTTFQFRSVGSEALAAIGVTMPPWPGDGEAMRAAGKWEPTVEPGPGLA